mmetsp:Transcript_997/g.3556  ORF Transcript_997/g.3556 Transcript_997/m.3556 type:complete len:200 (-) Transcript_997:942-1541(-)
MPVEKVVKFAAFMPRGSMATTRRQSPEHQTPTSSFILCRRSNSKSPSRPRDLTMFSTPSSLRTLARCTAWRERRLTVVSTYSSMPQIRARKVTSPMPKRLFWMMFTLVRSELLCTDQYFHGSPMPTSSYMGSNIFSTMPPGVGMGPWWTNQHGTRGLARFLRRVTRKIFFVPHSMHVRAFSTAKAPLPRMATLVSASLS